MEQMKGHFKVKKITKFEDLKENDEIHLPESDLAFQDGSRVYQFSYIEPNDDRKFVIKPGIFSFKETSAGIDLSKMELRERTLLDSVSNTAAIIGEARTFFSRLHVYERLQRLKKRGVLLYSSPGMGKTSAIEKVCADFINEDPGTVILIWPTSEVEPDHISRFLSQQSTYDASCTRMILIIEDIGGGEREGYHGRQGVTSGLLNLLDGVGVTFKLPTFIIATTNHPENLLASLANRPGRFDLMMKLNAPSAEERVKLLSFVCKRDLNEEEVKAITSKGTENFSIAHIEEVAVRAELHDKTFTQVVKELIEHTERFNKDFADKKGSVGFNNSDFD